MTERIDIFECFSGFFDNDSEADIGVEAIASSFVDDNVRDCFGADLMPLLCSLATAAAVPGPLMLLFSMEAGAEVGLLEVGAWVEIESEVEVDSWAVAGGCKGGSNGLSLLMDGPKLVIKGLELECK